MEFRTATPEDLDDIAELERASYPPDEAASREKFEFRLRVAPQLCRVAVDDGGRIIGFVCGTAVAGTHLTQESMHTHDPQGESVCIHSVVVEASIRRRRIGRSSMLDFVDHVRTLGGPALRVLLICKSYLIEFYAGAGFEMVGPSPVVHGADSWFEMVTLVE